MGTSVSARSAHKQRPPNVILILTDDQGIGDLGCHGNPWIKTPNIDGFYKDAVRLTDFHVSPVCTPARSAIMTGRYPINNGAWATYKGRDALHGESATVADMFKKNGYRTGIFGKWHLGDNYPVRATDMGFEVAVHHKAGGVGELSDYWGNSYFDDVYFVNNEPQQFEGYCTDVWFEEAMKFIKNGQDRPFFVYLPTNAPHSPFIVEDRYAAPYRPLVGDKIPNAEFYGMITNIDENFGKLEAFLKKEKLADNTILIFMTDNGSGGGLNKDGTLGFNKGFRGSKGDKTEGGHRVPFFIRWKDGKIQGGRDIDVLTTHVDLFPTLVSLCGLDLRDDMVLDGVDCAPLLQKKNAESTERTIFVHHRQDWRPPKDIEETCVMDEKWRLVNGDELYDIENDRHQSNNLADQRPEVVSRLLQENDAFVRKAKMLREYDEFPVTVIGSKVQPEVKLTIQHAIGEDQGIWKAEQVAEGMKNTNNTHALKIERNGLYTISIRRWPKECPGPILGVPKHNPKNGMFDYQAISPEKVRISIANQMHEKSIGPDDEEVQFNLHLEKGKTLLVNDFIEESSTYGVYYTYIKYLDQEKPENNTINR